MYIATAVSCGEQPAVQYYQAQSTVANYRDIFKQKDTLKNVKFSRNLKILGIHKQLLNFRISGICGKQMSNFLIERNERN